MVGIVLASHGKMAEGMIDSAKMLFSSNIEQLTYVSLKEGDAPEEFGEKLLKAIKSVDSGEGVILLLDLLGGTPCNQSLYHLSDHVLALTGMNLPMFLELLGLRISTVDLNELINISRNGILNLNEYITG